MDKLYQRINYENSPSKKTPLSEANLNKMDKALDDLDNRIIEQDAAFAKSIEEEGKKIEEVRGKVSEIAGKATALTQSKADAIVCSASGERITATDSAEAGFEQFRTFGWGKQEKTSGNQLAEKVIVSQSSNNLNRYSPVLWIEADLKPETTYTISFEGTVGNSLYINENITAYKQFKVVSGITTLTFTTVSNMDKANTNKYDSSNGWIIFKNDAAQSTANVFDNVMLVEGTEALPYEPYTGGIASPNPEYPQPIVSAGQKLAEGNQLFAYELLTYDSGSCTTDSDGYITFVANDGAIQYSRIVYDDKVGEYTIAVEVAESDVTSEIYFMTSADDYSTLIATSNTSSTVTKTFDGYMRVLFKVPVGATLKCKVMLNEGSIALPYEPYTGGVKAAYDVGISKRITGTNLLNLPNKDNKESNGVTWSCKNGAVTAKGTASATSNSTSIGISRNIPIIAGTYTLSGGGSAAKLHVKATLADGTVNYYSGTFTLDGTERTCSIFCQVNTGLTANETIYPMLNIGTKALPFEQGTEQTLTLNRVLHGIPTTVTSMATYTDENGQMWCADEIDMARKVLVQKCWYANIPLSSFTKTVKTNTINYRISTSEKTKGIGDTNKSKYAYCSICNKYLWDSADSVHWYADQSINIFVDKQYESVVDAMESVTVCYPLATPIEIPLTDEEIAAYKALHSNKPTTVITNDAGCFMEVEYVADPKNHIAQNYVPVTAFNDALERISALEQLHV